MKKIVSMLLGPEMIGLIVLLISYPIRRMYPQVPFPKPPYFAWVSIWLPLIPTLLSFAWWTTYAIPSSWWQLVRTSLISLLFACFLLIIWADLDPKAWHRGLIDLDFFFTMLLTHFLLILVFTICGAAYKNYRF